MARTRYAYGRKAATDNMLQIIETRANLPLYADVFEHPPPRLASRRPIWSEMTSVDTITQWREDWSSASAVKHTIVTDPTIRQPCFDLPRHTWSLMNRFWTGHVLLTCTNGVSPNHLPVIVASNRPWTMNHIVDTCPLMKFEGGLNLLHEADDDAVIWLESTATAALAKWTVHYKLNCIYAANYTTTSSSSFNLW